MDSGRVSLLGQRWRYFSQGDNHSVSANWLRKQCTGIYSTIGEFLQSEHSPAQISTQPLSLLEGEQVFRSILQKKSGANYEKNFDCEVELASLFLYAYILTCKLLTVIETGVTNRITTSTMMRALEQTRVALHSFEIDARTQNVYTGTGNLSFIT